MPVTFG